MKYFILATIIFLNLTSLALGQEAATESMNLVQMGMYYIDMIAQLMFAVMLAATVITRVIPGKKDDEAVKSAWDKIHKLLAYLPTLGINPRTKKMESALEEMNSSDK